MSLPAALKAYLVESALSIVCLTEASLPSSNTEAEIPNRLRCWRGRQGVLFGIALLEVARDVEDQRGKGSRGGGGSCDNCRLGRRGVRELSEGGKGIQ